MNRHSALFFLAPLLALTTAISACTSKEKEVQPTVPDVGRDHASPTWSAKMQELSQALNRLLPLVADNKAFNDPKNSAAIDDAALRLKKLSHQVRVADKPSADPAYDSIARMLDEDLSRAVSSLASGNRDFARLTIRESIGYCIQCHTQTASGPNFPRLELGFNPKPLSPLGRGDFFAATRQFDSALEAYVAGVSDAAYAKRDVFGWERAARSALAIAVRFKQSPKDARAIANSVLKNRAAPESLRTAAKSWLKSVDEWAAQPKAKSTKDLTGPELLTTAEGLINKADGQSEGGNRQDVPYLRASAILHQWLADNPLAPGKESPERAKALLLAGRAAEATRELNFWTLHEKYYELCIDTLPKSETSKACFKRLGESVMMGYTGSSGLNLPADEANRLARFKEKAIGQ